MHCILHFSIIIPVHQHDKIIFLCCWFRCPNLLSLTLSGCGHITDRDVINMLKSCRMLRSLSLENCARMTDSVLQAVVDHGHSLTDVRVDFCRNVTQAGLQEVRDKRPEVHLSALHSADMIPDSKPEEKTQIRRALQKFLMFSWQLEATERPYVKLRFTALSSAIMVQFTFVISKVSMRVSLHLWSFHPFSFHFPCLHSVFQTFYYCILSANSFSIQTHCMFLLLVVFHLFVCPFDSLKWLRGQVHSTKTKYSIYRSVAQSKSFSQILGFDNKTFANSVKDSIY